MNSLLGIPIAREVSRSPEFRSRFKADLNQGDNGGSCTLTSCRYEGLKKGQKTTFLAEVTFFNRKERRELLTEYLAAYYDATHEGAEIKDEPEEGPQSQEDVATNLEICKEVVDTFFSLFGGQRECRTKRDVRDYLDSARSREDERVLGQLQVWCDELIAKATGDGAFVTISASSVDELSQKLEDFTSLAEDDSGELAVSLTPIVSLITYYFDNPLTRLGIVFLDTPGTTDRNRARRKSAQTYRKTRTHFAVLSDESRAKDDGGIAKEVKTLSKGCAGRPLVVITRSDSINDKTMPSGSRKDKDTAFQLKKSFERIKNALNAVDIEKSDAIRKEDSRRLGALLLERTKLEVRLKLAKNAEVAHRIRMRSESNKKVIADKLRGFYTAADIFSISNLEYAKHMSGYNAESTPVLTLEQTNIPALRSVISAFPNEARLNEIKHQQERNLVTLLHRIRLYTEESQ